MKKRVLAMFLSVCMALCLLPATALAAPAPEGYPFLYAFDAPNGDIQLEIRASDDETVVSLGKPTDRISITREEMDTYKANGQAV